MYGCLFLASVGIGIVACKKEKVAPNSVNQENAYQKSESGSNELATNIDKANANSTKKGQIACSVKDANGKEICAGTRCGTPTGTCGYKYTECACVSLKTIDPTSTSKEDFIKLWNNPTTREKLKLQGYHAEDKK